jgi:hypothetical protein
VQCLGLYGVGSTSARQFLSRSHERRVTRLIRRARRAGIRALIFNMRIGPMSIPTAIEFSAANGYGIAMLSLQETPRCKAARVGGREGPLWCRGDATVCIVSCPRRGRPGKDCFCPCKPYGECRVKRCARGSDLSAASSRRRKSYHREDTHACDTALNILRFPARALASQPSGWRASCLTRCRKEQPQWKSDDRHRLLVGIIAKLLMPGRVTDGYYHPRARYSRLVFRDCFSTDTESVRHG